MKTASQSWFEDAKVGGRVPAVELPSANGPPVKLRRRDRFSTVLVRVNPEACPGCSEYLQEIDAALRDLRVWDGRVLAVVAGDVEDARKLKSETGVRFQVLADPSGARAAGAERRDNVVVVADRWGEIYHVARSETARELPGPRELEDWLRFLATQCPE